MLSGPREGRGCLPAHAVALCSEFSTPFTLFRKSADRTPPLLSVVFTKGHKMATQDDVHT